MNKQFTYYPQGTCSTEIQFEIDENDCVQNVSFTGGCNGNLQGISQLVRGMNRKDVIRKLQGIRCGMKRTSCPDQFAQALASVED